MKKILILLIIAFCFSYCKKKENEDSEILKKSFIISEFWKPITSKKTVEENNIPPPPPPSICGTYLYCNNIFIIDKKSNIYYLQREKILGFICGTGMEDETIPLFMGIKPENIIQIPNKSIYDFVKMNIRKGERNRICISSQLDTLKSSNYYRLIKSLEQSINEDDKDAYIIRRTSIEEDTVLNYVGKDKYYDPEKIKWDMTKIKFNSLKFVKQKD